MAAFGISVMIPARLCLHPKRRQQRPSCSASQAHISSILLSTSPSLGAICFGRLYNDKYFTAEAETHQKMKQTEERDTGAEERAPNKKTRAPAWPWMTPEVILAWKTAFRSLCLFLCLYLPLVLSFACRVESKWCFACLQPGGKTELQSQAAKWWKTLASRDAVSLDQELRARENARFST